MSAPKILIIEDEEALLDMYRLRFAKDGYKIFSASRGPEGIRLAKQEQPDLILLDVVMPEMDGYEVLQKLKSSPATKKLRVIFLSNLGQKGEVQDGLKMGAEDYIIKASLTPSLLVKKVEEKLGITNVARKESNGNVAPRRPSPLGEQSCVGFRVLLIEDNEAIIDMYKIRLEKEGAVVTVAKNGAWGIKEAKKGEHDIILIDMIMPAMNGLEAIKTLKNNPKTANIPILVFSNSAQEEDLKKAKEAGAVNYFVKSNIIPATLVQEIKKYCKIKSRI